MNIVTVQNASWQKTLRGNILLTLFPSSQGDLQLLWRIAIYSFSSQYFDFANIFLSEKVIVRVQHQVQLPVLYNVQMNSSEQSLPYLPTAHPFIHIH